MPRIWNNSKVSYNKYGTLYTEKRMGVLAAAKAEVNAVIAERKIMAAPKRDIPPTADRLYKMEENVIVYSKKKKGIAPLIVVDVFGRMINV